MSELRTKMMKTPDLNQERLETLKKLYPDLFTIEGKLNPDELKKIIDPSLTKETERFEFKWYGKSESKRIAFTPSQATLVYDESRSVNPEFADGNMIVEGENLEALKVLLNGYREKIQCIYIDPPYNTGKDFVYSDNFDEQIEDYWTHIGTTVNGLKVTTNNESDGRFHSNWLNLMYPRLLLSRQLLKQEGVVFISIDNNEISNLQKMANEVFGEENCVGIIANINNPKGRSDDKYIATAHEYILVYAKDKNFTQWFGFEPAEHITKRYTKGDSTNPYREIDLRKTGENDRREDRPNLFYYFYYNELTKDFFPSRDDIKKDGYIQIRPLKDNGEEGNWRWGLDTCKSDIAKLMVRYMPNRKIWGVFEKDYLEGRNLVKPTSAWTFKDVNSERGSEQFIELGFDKEVFPKPKPLGTIKRCIQIATKENDYVLDFFAGSGTTAHAVIEMGNETGLNRRFIIVQAPESINPTHPACLAGFTKITDITIARVKKVLSKKENQEQLALTNSDEDSEKIGFKTFYLAKSHFPRVEFAPDPAKSNEENLSLLNQYIKEKEAAFNTLFESNTFYDEVLLKNGFMLNYTLEPVASIKKNKVYLARDEYKETLVCLDASISKETLSALEPLKEKTFICLERALDTTMKWNLKHELGDKLIAL